MTDPHARTTPPHYELHWPGKLPWQAATRVASFRHTDAFDLPPPRAAQSPSLTPDTQLPAPSFRNRLVFGDNLAAMEALLPEFRGRVDLIYLDPPFDADQEFTLRAPLGEGAGMGESREEAVEAVAYRDVWGEGRNCYAQMFYERLPLLRELLSDTGSLIVHVNWRVGHLVQLLLDEVFGAGERARTGAPGFRCEIVWGYGGGGAVKNVYRRKHDNLFWYSRSERWKFNPQYRPYSDGTRQRGLTAIKGDRYELRDEGASLETWWTGPEVQKILSPTAYENLKFPTQKPEALLERIIRGHSDEGDLVADFFCGSGTTGVVAERLGRRWLLADQGRHALLTTRKRLAALQLELHAASLPCRAFDVFEISPSRGEEDV